MSGRITVPAGGYRGVAFTKVLIALLALEARSAGSGPVEDHGIAGSDTLHIPANLVHFAGAFVTHHDGFPPGKGIVVGMANAGRFYPNDYFIGLRLGNFD